MVEDPLKQAVFDHLCEPALCITASGQVLAFNTAARKILKLPQERVPGCPIAEMLGFGRVSQVQRRWARLWRQLVPDTWLDTAVRIPLADGHQLDARIRAQLIVTGREAVALVFVQDYAQTRATARQAQRSAAQTAALLHVRQGFSALLGSDQKLKHVSAGADMPLGGEPETLIGLPFDYLLDEASGRDFHKHFEALLGQGPEAVISATWRMRSHRDWPARWIQCRLQNRLCDTRIQAVLLDAQDVTEQREPLAQGEAVESHLEASAVRRLRYRDQLLELAFQVHTDFQVSAASIARAVTQALACTQGAVWQQDTQASELQCVTLYERIAGHASKSDCDQTVSLTQTPRLADLANGAICAIADSHTEGAVGLPPPEGMRAALMAPIDSDGVRVGVLVLQDQMPRVWTQEETEYLQTAARVLALAYEASQRRAAQQRAHHLAWFDSLTGLPNRNSLRDTMREKIAAAAQNRKRLAVLLVDLDRFKDVNDTLGHLVGDALIKSAAQVIHDTVGEAGVVGRLGGDEFVIVADAFQHRQEIALLAAGLTQALNRTDLVAQVDTQVSASIGVALYPEHGRDASTLLKNADAAMYQAKQEGRNQFGFFNPIKYERGARQVRLGVQLHKALHTGQAQFFIEYQPQVEISSGKVVGLEALIRWQHPVLGRLTPDVFIAVAEHSGLSERITRWAVNEVCAQIVRWRQEVPGFDIPVAVNVAARELGSSHLPMLVRSALMKHAVEPSMLLLEVTERTRVQDTEANNDVLTELAALGIGLVLDDFGTGYSMLGYLKRMPTIQALKIDQSFIKGMPADADSGAIIQAMLIVARQFKLKVIAEGVESQKHVDYLRQIGCAYAQGYWYAKALPPQAIADALRPPRQ